MKVFAQNLGKKQAPPHDQQCHQGKSVGEKRVLHGIVRFGIQTKGGGSEVAAVDDQNQDGQGLRGDFLKQSRVAKEEEGSCNAPSSGNDSIVYPRMDKGITQHCRRWQPKGAGNSRGKVRSRIGGHRDFSVRPLRMG